MLFLVDVSLFYLIGIISNLLFEYLYHYTQYASEVTNILQLTKYIIPCHHKNHQKKQIIYTICYIYISIANYRVSIVIMHMYCNYKFKYQ